MSHHNHNPYNSHHHDHDYIHRQVNPQRTTYLVNGLPTSNPTPSTLPAPMSTHLGDMQAQPHLQASVFPYSTQPASNGYYAPTSLPISYSDFAHSSTVPVRPPTSAAPSNPLPPIHPMPQSNGNLSQGLQPKKENQQRLASASTPPGQDVSPKHVVGSQGRRGILPTVTGRPVGSPSANGGKDPQPIIKDADGKYPCPACHKPYLHAKHLKRHMLRRKFSPLSCTY